MIKQGKVIADNQTEKEKNCRKYKIHKILRPIFTLFEVNVPQNVLIVSHMKANWLKLMQNWSLDIISFQLVLLGWTVLAETLKERNLYVYFSLGYPKLMSSKRKCIQPKNWLEKRTVQSLYKAFLLKKLLCSSLVTTRVFSRKFLTRNMVVN